MGHADGGGDPPPPEASKPAQNYGPTVTRNEEGEPTSRFGPSAAKVAQAPSDAIRITSQPAGTGQLPQPSQTLSAPNTDFSPPSTMAGNATDTDVIHQVHSAESNTTTITVRGGRYDTSSVPDPVKEASAEVMKGRKISKPKGKSSARLTVSSAVLESMDSMANLAQAMGLQSPTVPPSAQPTLPAESSNTSEPRDLAATPSPAKPTAPARSSRLAARMKEQQHEPSKLGSILDEIAKPTVTTYTPYGPSTRIGSLRDEIIQPPVATYAPHPHTSQSPPKQQVQTSRIASPPDEISQPWVTTYTPRPPTSQFPPKQVDRTSPELVVSSASIIPQDVTPVLTSTAGVVRQNASLLVPQPSQLPASQVMTPPLPLAASVNSNIPLFHPSMFPNPNKHFIATQNPASSGSYGYLSQIPTERSVTPYSPSTAMPTKQTKEEGLIERDVSSQMKPYPVPSSAFGNPRPGASFSTHTSLLFGQALQHASPYALPSVRPSMSNTLRDSPTNPNWKLATHAFVPSVPPTPWSLQNAMNHDEGELLPASDTLPSILDDPETTSTADSDEIKYFKPTVAAIIPQPMYRPTMNNELDDLDAVSEAAQSPSTLQYNQKEEVVTYDAEATAHTPPVAASQPTFKIVEDIASAEVETKEEVPVIKKGGPSSPEEAVTTPECSDTVQNIEIKQVDLDPKYFKYRNKEARKTRPFHWDIEDNRDPRSGYDCTDEEMKEIINGLLQLKLRVPKCPTITPNNESRLTEFPAIILDNEIRVTECSTTNLNNESLVIECPTTILDSEIPVSECSTTILDNEIRVVEDTTTALDNESRVIESATQALDNESRVIKCPTTAPNSESPATECPSASLNNEIVQFQICSLKPAPTPSIEESLLPNSSNWNVPKQDGTIRDLCVVEPSSAAYPLAENVREGESTISDLQGVIRKQSFKMKRLEKKAKEQKETRMRIWRSTVDEAIAKRSKNHAQRVAELDHRENLLALESSKFEADCADRKEELTSREKDLASKERGYAQRLKDLQTREAQLAESRKQLELQQDKQRERDKAATSRLEKAQEDLERLKEEKKQCEDDAKLRFMDVQEELERLKKEKERAKFSSDPDRIPPVEVSKGSPDIPCNDSADLSTVSSSGSSKTPSMLINDRDIELENTRLTFTDTRVFEDPNQIEQNLMFSRTWDCDSDIEYDWSIFIDARVSEDPQQIEQDLMFSSTWNMEESVTDIPGASTRSHWKWMFALFLGLTLLTATISNPLLQLLASRLNVILQHLPDTCSYAERPVTIPSPISQSDFLCLADYSNNYSEASSFPVSGFIDLENDVRPFGERVVDISRVREPKTSPSTRTVFKIWFWNFVMTSTAYGRVGAEAGRRELYH